MFPCPRKAGYQAVAAVLLAAAWGIAIAETGEDGDSLFAQPPAALFPTQRAAAGEGSQWSLSTRHRHRGISTDFGLYLTELRDSQLQPPPATEAIMAMDRAENEMFFRRRASPAYLTFEPRPTQGTVPQNKLDYIASHIAKVRLSSVQTLPATILWDKAVIRLDIGRQRFTNTPRNAGTFDPGTSRSNRAIQVQFAPSWSEVLPNLDVSLPITVGYSSKAQAPLPGLDRSYRGARLTIGASAVYEKAWKADLRYMHYFQEPTYPMKDRDFLWLSIQRGF